MDNAAQPELPSWLMRKWQNLYMLLCGIGLQAKLKSLLSFYQVVAVLGPVYGVHLPSEFASWTHFLNHFAEQISGLLIPTACIGSMATRLLVAALAPLLFIALAHGAIVARNVLLDRRAGKPDTLWTHLHPRRALPIALVVSYCVLPSVSRTICSVWHCESFGYDDLAEPKKRIAYLVADRSIECNSGDHLRLQALEPRRRIMIRLS